MQFNLKDTNKDYGLKYNMWTHMLNALVEYSVWAIMIHSHDLCALCLKSALKYQKRQGLCLLERATFKIGASGWNIQTSSEMQVSL